MLSYALLSSHSYLRLLVSMHASSARALHNRPLYFWCKGIRVRICKPQTAGCTASGRHCKKGMACNVYKPFLCCVATAGMPCGSSSACRHTTQNGKMKVQGQTGLYKCRYKCACKGSVDLTRLQCTRWSRQLQSSNLFVAGSHLGMHASLHTKAAACSCLSLQARNFDDDIQDEGF